MSLQATELRLAGLAVLSRALASQPATIPVWVTQIESMMQWAKILYLLAEFRVRLAARLVMPSLA